MHRTPHRAAFALGATLAMLAAVPIAAAEDPAEPSPSPAARLPNGAQPLPNVITGGQPTAEQLAALGEAGYTTVISLRAEGEKGDLAAATYESLGLDFVRVPIAGADDLDEAHVRDFAAALADAEGPVVVHCGSGNRVGALFALQAHWLEGMRADDALDFGLAAGLTGLEPTVRERLGLPEAADQP